LFDYDVQVPLPLFSNDAPMEVAYPTEIACSMLLPA
jgi:hypothetical protein